MLEPKGEIKLFENASDKLDCYQRWGLATAAAKKVKETLKYKGIYSEEHQDCDVIGYIDECSLVIKLWDGNQTVIHPSYLKQMQQSKFKITHYESESATDE